MRKYFFLLYFQDAIPDFLWGFLGFFYVYTVKQDFSSNKVSLITIEYFSQYVIFAIYTCLKGANQSEIFGKFPISIRMFVLEG